MLFQISNKAQNNKGVQPGYEQDIEYVSECVNCQKRTATEHIRQISCDIMEPLLASVQGNKYILVVLVMSLQNGLKYLPERHDFNNSGNRPGDLTLWGTSMHS